MSYDWDSEDDYFQSDTDSEYETIQSPNAEIVQDPRKVLEEQIQDAASNGRLIELHHALIDNKIGIQVNTPLSGGWTPLMFAAYASQADVVEYLIKHNANVNQDANRLTPLMCACLSQSFSMLMNFSTVKKLLEAGAKVNLNDINRETPLMKAIESGKVEVVKLLIPHANLEMMDSFGRTAVFYAVIFKQDEILKILIKQGASLHKFDKDNKSIKDLPSAKSHEPTKKILQTYLPDHPMEDDYFIIESMKDWKEMFPGILPTNKPAFWYEIPALLYGMHCEKALKPLKDANVNLGQFLTLTNDEMQDLNITFPYLRKRLKAGLYKFHSYKWNLNTVLGYSSNLNKNMDYKMCLDFFGSHLKHLTVMKSSYVYVNKILKTQPISLPPEMEPKIDRMLSQISKMKIEFKKFKEIILEVNKLNPIPADLITAPKKTYISRKKIFYVTVFSAAVFIAIMKTRNY